jgi:hypothetical protein
MLMMAVPLTILFMVSAYAVKIVQKKNSPEEDTYQYENEIPAYEAPKALANEYETPIVDQGEESDSDHVHP